MRRLQQRRLSRSVDAARKAMAVGSLEMDRDRDIADLETMRRIVMIYMPLLALGPIIAGAIYLMNG